MNLISSILNVEMSKLLSADDYILLNVQKLIKSINLS